MTRAERRRAERKEKHLTATYTMSQGAINKIKSEAVWDAIDAAFVLMIGLPIGILQDNFGKLMKKEGREQKFADLLLDRYEAYKDGYVTLDDIITTLKAETGITLPGVIYDPAGGKVRYDSNKFRADTAK